MLIGVAVTVDAAIREGESKLTLGLRGTSTRMLGFLTREVNLDDAPRIHVIGGAE